MDVWATNSSTTAIECLLEISAYDLESDWSWTSSTKDVFVLQPNSSTELRTAVPVPAPDSEKTAGKTVQSGSVVVQARLVAVNSFDEAAQKGRTLVARISDWPQPYKFIDFARLADDAEVSAEIAISGEHSRITLSSTRPIKCLSLELESWKDGEAEVDFSDNAVSIHSPRLCCPQAFHDVVGEDANHPTLFRLTCSPGMSRSSLPPDSQVGL
jgi:beta-mannosidase